jgi:hypothetical protein
VRGGSIFDSPELRQLWNKARAALTKDPTPEDPKKTLTLEVRPEEVKVLYARALALQALVDGWLDPREIEYLYMFMSRVSISSDSREEVRQTLATREASPEDVGRLVEGVISAVPDNKEEIAVSIIKDMVHLSRADNAVLPQEKAAIEAAAEAHFGERAPKVIELAEKTVKYEKALVGGKVSAGELETHVKEIVALATAASVPITAIFFSGSVVGLSAAGITSGLAALGLGGILGLSAMVTGIGIVVVIGVTAYAATRYALGSKDRELARQADLHADARSPDRHLGQSAQDRSHLRHEPPRPQLGADAGAPSRYARLDKRNPEAKPLHTRQVGRGVDEHIPGHAEGSCVITAIEDPVSRPFGAWVGEIQGRSLSYSLNYASPLPMRSHRSANSSVSYCR